MKKQVKCCHRTFNTVLFKLCTCFGFTFTLEIGAVDGEAVVGVAALGNGAQMTKKRE